MTILDRYLLRSFWAVLVAGTVVMAALFLVISVVDSLTWMMAEQGVPLRLIVLYYLSMLPYAMYMTLPLGVLFSGLITLGLLSRRNEVTAVKAGGISVLRLSRPMIFSAGVLCGFMFWFGDSVVLAGNRKAHELDIVMFHHQERSEYRRQKIWYVSEREGQPPWIYRIQNFIPEEDRLEGLAIYQLDQRHRVREMIEAEDGKYQDQAWLLGNVVVRDFPEDGEVSVEKKESMTLSIPETARDFLLLQRAPDEMNLAQLREQIEKVRLYGFDTKDYLVELQSRKSIPLAPLILILIAIPFALPGRETGGLAKGIFIAVVIGFAYYVFMAESLSLGRNGTLSPLAAAWTANAIFALLGLTLISGVKS